MSWRNFIESLKTPDRCKRCGIRESLGGPFIDGLCKFCREQPEPEHKVDKKRANGEEYIAEIIQKVKEEKHEYDAMVMFSGGKDSSYLVYYLASHFDLKILAVTMDNWFLSDDTRRNINNIVQCTGVDHLTIKFSWDVWKKVYKAFIVKSGMRPRAICWPCNIMSERIAYTVLNKYDIGLYMAGNPTHEEELFAQWLRNFMKKYNVTPSDNFNYDYWLTWHIAYKDLLQKVLDEEDHDLIEEVIPPHPKKNDQALKTKTFYPLSYLDYDPIKNIEELEKECGWVYPKDVGGTQTDCRGMQFNIELYKKLHGEEAYEEYITKLVREGEIPLEIGLRAIEYKEPGVVEDFFKKLELSWDMYNPQSCPAFLDEWLKMLKPIK